MKVKIQVTDDLRIVSDAIQWKLQREKLCKDEDGAKIMGWRSFAYYPSCAMAVRSMVEVQLRECGARSFEELFERLDAIVANLEDKMKVHSGFDPVLDQRSAPRDLPQLLRRQAE